MAGPIKMAILANGRQARREIHSVASALDRLDRTGIGSAIGEMEDLTRGAARASLVTTGVVSAIAAVGAAAGPLLGIGGGVVAAMGAAGIGVAAFAALAAPAFGGVADATDKATKAQEAYDAAIAAGDSAAATKALQDRKAALDGLTPAQREATLATLDMKSAFSEASEGFATPSLEAYSRVLRTLIGLLPLLVRIATPVQAVLVKQVDRLRQAVSGPEFEAFAGRLAQHVGPVLGEISDLIANVGMVLGHVIDQALPFAAAYLAIFTGLFGQLRQAAAGSGLTDFFATMLPVAQQLGAFIGQLVGAIGGLIQAAAPLGGPLLSTLTALAAALHATFAGADFSSLVGSLGRAFAALTPLLGPILGLLAKVAAAVGGQLAPVITALTPAIKLLTGEFGGIVQAVAPLLPLLAGIISSVAQALIPVIAELVPPLVEGLKPILTTLAKDVLPQVAPQFLQIVQAITPFIPQISQIVVQILQLVPQITGLIAAIVQWYAATGNIQEGLRILGVLISGIVKILSGVIQVIRGIITGDWTAVWNGAKQIVSGAWTAISGLIQFGLNQGLAILRMLPGNVAGLFTSAWSRAVTNTTTGWSRLKSSISTGISNAIATLKALPGRIVGVFAGAAGWLRDAGKRIMDGLISGISRGIDRVQQMLNSVTTMIPAWKGPPARDSVLLYDAGRSIMAGLVDGLTAGEAAVRDQLGQLTGWIQHGLDSATASDLGVSLNISGTALAAAGGRGDTTVEIKVEVPIGADKAAIGKAIVDAIREYARLTGTDLI